MEQEVEQVRKLLEKGGRVVIVTHQSPDGDAIGSALGLYNFLVNEGFSVGVVTPDKYPAFLQWLPGNDSVFRYEDDKEKGDRLVKAADLLFCLDFNSLSRLDAMAGSVEEAGGRKVLVDHHPEPGDFAEVVLSDTESSSTAQLVYELITAIGGGSAVNRAIGECLYVGIMTDTGSFRFSSTSARTHRITAELIEKGVDSAVVQDRVYDTNSFDRMRLLGYALSEKLEIYPEFCAAVMVLSEKELHRFNAQKGDTEGFVNYALSVKGTNMAVFITQRKGIVKLSFRSKGNIPVNDIAREHFGGGGHINAAGGRSEESLEETHRRLIGLLPRYKGILESHPLS